MSQRDKLIAEIKNLNRNLRFNELSKILTSIGYIAGSPKSGTSHVTFRKPNNRPITVPKENPINVAYIELIREAIIRHESEESL